MECIFHHSRAPHLVNLFEMNAKYASVVQSSTGTPIAPRGTKYWALHWQLTASRIIATQNRMNKENIMNRLKAIAALPLIVGALDFFAATSWSAEAFVLKVADPSGQYCHLKFPAITEDTLFSDRRCSKARATAISSTFTDPATTTRWAKSP